MSGEKCRHCGAPIQYVTAEEFKDWTGGKSEEGFWSHIGPTFGLHEAAPAFGGGS